MNLKHKKWHLSYIFCNANKEIIFLYEQRRVKSLKSIHNTGTMYI